MKAELHICDLCGTTRYPDGGNIAWYDQIKCVNVSCPPDGMNGGVFAGDLCSRCRGKVWDAVAAAIDDIKAEAQR